MKSKKMNIKISKSNDEGDQDNSMQIKNNQHLGYQESSLITTTPTRTKTSS